MTEADLVAKKLAEVETYVHELRTLARLDRLESDLREQRFICHTLQLAIQGVLDIASHIVSDERLGEPTTLRELFALLARGSWIEAELVPSLQKMAGFRNLLVHEYGRIDLGLVRDAVENRLGDIEAFVAAVRSRVGQS